MYSAMNLENTEGQHWEKSGNQNGCRHETVGQLEFLQIN